MVPIAIPSGILVGRSFNECTRKSTLKKYYNLDYFHVVQKRSQSRHKMNSGKLRRQISPNTDSEVTNDDETNGLPFFL